MAPPPSPGYKGTGTKTTLPTNQPAPADEQATLGIPTLPPQPQTGGLTHGWEQTHPSPSSPGQQSPRPPFRRGQLRAYSTEDGSQAREPATKENTPAGGGLLTQFSPVSPVQSQPLFNNPPGQFSPISPVQSQPLFNNLPHQFSPVSPVQSQPLFNNPPGQFSPVSPVQSQPLRNHPSGQLAPISHIQSQPLQRPAFAAPLQQPARSSKGRGRTLTIIIGLLLVISLLGTGGYLVLPKLLSGPHKTIQRTHPTPVPTLAPLTNTDPHDLYTQAKSRKALVNDPLHAQGDDDWEAANTNGNCTFTGGALHALGQAGSQATICLAQSMKFRNIAFQAQVTIQQGDSAGLVLRADSLGRKAYIFSITSDGMYIFSFINQPTDLQTHVLTGGTSSAIKQGSGQLNQLTIIARNTTFYFYINDQFIAQLDDTTYTSGMIGLFGGDSQGGASEAIFNNVQLWSV